MGGVRVRETRRGRFLVDFLMSDGANEDAPVLSGWTETLVHVDVDYTGTSPMHPKPHFLATAVLGALLPSQGKLDLVTMTFPDAAQSPDATRGPSPAPELVTSLLGADAEADTLIDIDPVTAKFKTLGKLADPVVGALAWVPTTKTLFGSSAQNDVLLKIDPANGKITRVGSYGTGVQIMQGLSFNPLDGKLYGGDIKNTYTIDMKTGKATKIGAHGFWTLGDIAFDFTRNTMFATDPFSKKLYTIDLKTGKPTQIGVFKTGRLIGTGLTFHPTLGLYASDNQGSQAADDVLYRIDLTAGRAVRVGFLGSRNTLGLEFVSACLPATSRPYGAGHKGTRGIPTLTSTPPLQGKLLTLSMSNSLGASTPGWLLVNGARANLPTFWGGTLHVLPTNGILLGVNVPANGLSVRVTVPSSIGCGTFGYAQGVMIDRGASAGLSNTAGLELRVGK